MSIIFFLKPHYRLPLYRTEAIPRAKRAKRKRKTFKVSYAAKEPEAIAINPHLAHSGEALKALAAAARVERLERDEDEAVSVMRLLMLEEEFL